MARASLVLALSAAALLACNNSYQFAPAGSCLIQPGSVQVRLDPTSSADILFVVDDSPSTNEKQAGLAASFGDFISRMVQTNVARISRGLDPIDFQIAVTTTAVFEAKPASGWCVGGNSCCQATSCTNVASCGRGTGAGCGPAQVCLVEPLLDPTAQYVVGEQPQCCAVSSCTPGAGCAGGDPCPVVQTTFSNPFPNPGFCTPGLAVAGAPYPSGGLVAAPANDRVLRFDKSLDWASWGTGSQDPRLTALVGAFQQNVRVGSCGSGEEQGLEAARLTFEKAVAGRLDGGAGFPRPGAKLVVVWVADEDDCSSPASAPLVMSVFSPGADSCVFDKHRAAADQREIPVSSYADFFASLVHQGAASFAAAVIVSPSTNACFGAWAGGERYLAFADALEARGVEVVRGTVCDAYPPASFGPVLSQIADLARSPAMLKLPTQPASVALTTVTIADANGITRRTCTQGTDWCFVPCDDTSAAPACVGAGTTTQCIGIDHVSGSCEANPGETYSAAYLGLLPAGGCATATECQAVLGGSAKDWACTKEPGASRGTCTCSR